MSPVWNGCKFDHAQRLRGWQAPRFGGIYAISYIVVKVDGSRVHRVLYFGRSRDLSSRNIGPDHAKYKCWKRHAGGPLYVSVHREDDRDRRSDKERDLVEAYEPKCNEIYT